MTFLEKIKQPIFWTGFAKIAIPFFIILIMMTLLWKNWSAIFNADFETISKINFEDGRWKTFFASKFFASVLYGLYVTNKNMK
jgi:hypothetical protein